MTFADRSSRRRAWDRWRFREYDTTQERYEEKSTINGDSPGCEKILLSRSRSNAGIEENTKDEKKHKKTLLSTEKEYNKSTKSGNTEHLAIFAIEANEIFSARTLIFYQYKYEDHSLRSLVSLHRFFSPPCFSTRIRKKYHVDHILHRLRSSVW